MRDFFVLSDLDDIVIDCRRASRPLDVCLACLHADGRLELLSAAWEGLLGYAPAELDGRSFLSLMNVERAAARALLRRLLDRARPDPVALHLLRKDGSARTLHVHRLFDEYEPSLYLAGEPFQPPEMSRAITSTSAFSSA